MNFISDIITKIRNGYSTRSEYITYKMPHTNIPAKLFEVLNIMRKMGIIRSFENNVVKNDKASCVIYLKYDASGVGIRDTVFIISKPSRRVYLSAASL